jgi:hypothetical protein
MSGLVPTSLGPRSNLLAGKFVGLLFENANTPYAEVLISSFQSWYMESV